MNEARQILRTYHWQLRVTERRTLLILGDLLMAFAALAISLFYWGMSERFMGFSMEFLQKRVPVWFFLLPIVWLILMANSTMYIVQRILIIRFAALPGQS
jgi:hypothetical protein